MTIVASYIETDDHCYLADILLLCVTCRQPIKATITSERWVRVEWISSEGECRDCHRERKQGGTVNAH